MDDTFAPHGVARPNTVRQQYGITAVAEGLTRAEWNSLSRAHKTTLRGKWIDYYRNHNITQPSFVFYIEPEREELVSRSPVTSTLVELASGSLESPA